MTGSFKAPHTMTLTTSETKDQASLKVKKRVENVSKSYKKKKLD